LRPDASVAQVTLDDVLVISADIVKAMPKAAPGDAKDDSDKDEPKK
jgi:hypothetical protein